MHVPFLIEVVVFLLAAVVVVPLARKLGASPILGYLAAGVAVGPSGFGLVADVGEVRAFAELGVVFLLFSVGLELSFERLKTFAPLIFGLGAAQVAVTAGVIGAIAHVWGNSLPVSAVLGLCLALSSTAMVVQLLAERGQLTARHGRASFAVLLFQDLAVVPILMLVTLLGTQDEGGASWVLVPFTLVKAGAVVAALLLAGHLLLPRLFQLVAASRSQEVFVAMALLTILLTSLATGLAGLSMALGAFLAGLLLSKSEFRHQIESDIEPFKGLLLGLFFMSVGMSIDLPATADRAALLVLSVAGLIGLKAVITFGLCIAFGQPRDVSLRSALLLAQAGEFAFVVIGVAALQYRLIVPDLAQFMVIVAGMSMAVTPLLAVLAEHGGRWLRLRAIGDAADAGAHATHGHVLIAGFGRIGQTVAKLLAERQVAYVALDLDLARIKACRKAGLPVFYGNAANREVLSRLGAGEASAILVTMDDAHATEKTLAAIRQHWPKARVIVRARDRPAAAALRALGASDVVPETLEASLQLAGMVLRATGLPAETVNDQIERIRERDYEGFDELCGDEPRRTGTGRIDRRAAVK